ncbi:MAG: RNB domain-containing ribonuclease [Candidatus Dadabacteria bacterium]|nr:RNB domain-containing ribonuclease [Candidatus Dadabacteria bacterium]
MILEKLPRAGEVLLFRKRQEPSLGIFSHLEGNKAAVFSEEGREVTVDPDKIAFVSSVTITGDLTQSEKKLALRDLRRRLDEAREEIDLVTVWECFEGETREVPYKELAEFYYAGEGAGEFDALAFFWSVDKNDVYFRRGEAGYEPRARDEADEIIHRKEVEQKKKEEREKAVIWAKGIISGHALDLGDFTPDAFIELLRGYVIHLDKFSRAPEAKSFLSEIGIRDPEGTIEFLVKAGGWGEDEDPMIKRFYVRENFPDKVLAETERIMSGPAPKEGFRDLTHLDIFSIDDENTEDIDDALSMEEAPGGGMVIGIHIANVAALVQKWGDADEEASKRGETIYLPEKRIHMFPPDFIRERLSLVKDTERLSLSLMVNVDEALSVKGTEFVASVIRVGRNMTYKEGTEYFLNDPVGMRMREFALRLRSSRLEAGALIVQLPQLKVRTGEGGAISIEKNPMNSEAHVAVAEMMILMNRTAGKFLKDRRIPGIYRSQPESVSEDARVLDDTNPLYPLQIVKFLRAPRIGLDPDVHRSLGIDVYTQVTSPIRRYADLVMQRQILSELQEGEPMYTEDELENLYPMIEVGIRDKKTIERNRERYWIYKHLKSLEGTAINGIISSTSGRRIGVYLPDYLFETTVSHGQETAVTEGDRVRLFVTKVDPLRRILTLSLA